ncbi:NifB/NifX family molybdenum-iron cluster-binding protein [Clostridium peptidivorans]|uniref:NifB/NifX family molybdenum-iron cluster-binding protein n=1 Tax=Clostridium peptidivorans TaxID=100174 RepID=UPI000BE3050D|nr:NifB/NifX family molybdenum-iron cluster-binding protein [Clostridium peptidivorans]
MKIALPKDGEMINQHFGRSSCFAIVDIEQGRENKIVQTKEISTESLQHNHEGLADILENQGVSVVITGGIGENAYNALEEKGLGVVCGASGKIDDIMQRYLQGELVNDKATCANQWDHSH